MNNNMGVGYCPAPAGNEMIMMLCLLMIMYPGMFGGCGDNSMIFFLLIFMMFSGGRF